MLYSKKNSQGFWTFHFNSLYKRLNSSTYPSSLFCNSLTCLPFALFICFLTSEILSPISFNLAYRFCINSRSLLSTIIDWIPTFSVIQVSIFLYHSLADLISNDVISLSISFTILNAPLFLSLNSPGFSFCSFSLLLPFLLLILYFISF